MHSLALRRPDGTSRTAVQSKQPRIELTRPSKNLSPEQQQQQFPDAPPVTSLERPQTPLVRLPEPPTATPADNPPPSPLTRPRVVAQSSAGQTSAGQDSEPSALATIDPPALTRPRRIAPSDHLEDLRVARNTLATVPLERRTGRPKSALKAALFGAIEGFARGGLAGGIGGAVGGAVSGGINPMWDEKLDRRRELAKLDSDIGRELVYRGATQKLRASEADVNYKQAQTNYYRTGKPAEAQGRELNRHRSSVLSNLRLLKGTMLDVNNPTHLALLQRAAEVGVNVDPDSWNNSNSNLVSIEVVDPENPTQKRKQFFNKQTGEVVADAGQSGYVQPVKESGMTEAQERGDSDRDESRTETVRHNKATEVFGQGNLNLSRDRYVETTRHNAVGEGQARERLANGGTRGGKATQVNQAAAAITRLNTTISQAQGATTQRKREALIKKANVEGQLIRARFGDAVEDDPVTGLPTRLKPQVAPAGSGGGSKYSGRQFSPDSLPAIAERMGKSPAEARRIVESQGGLFR